MTAWSGDRELGVREQPGDQLVSDADPHADIGQSEALAILSRSSGHQALSHAATSQVVVPAKSEVSPAVSAVSWVAS